MVGGAPAVSIPARVAAALLACVVRGPAGPAAAAAATWLCVAAVLLAGCGSPGQARPGAPGTGRSAVTSGAWRAESSGTRQRLYAVACLSALRCEAVGAAGTILSTGDGGATWRAQASPLRGSPAILYRIACVAPSSCYVIARPDTILVDARRRRHLEQPCAFPGRGRREPYQPGMPVGSCGWPQRAAVPAGPAGHCLRQRQHLLRRCHRAGRVLLLANSRSGPGRVAECHLDDQ